MNKYLIEILKLRTSVTLPGFGALMIANSRTGKIVLNQLLKYDDKVLAKFIAEKENIELQEAQNMVSKFVKEIDLDLSKGETYDIFQFGKLSKTENGSILFEMDDSMKKEQATAIVSTPKPVVKVEEPKEDSKTKDKPVAENKKEEPKAEVKPVDKPKVVIPKVVKKKEVKKETVKPKVKEKEIPKNVYTPPAKPKSDSVEKPVEKVEAKKVEAKKVVIVEKKDEKITPLTTSKTVETKPEPKALSAKEKAKQEKEANKKWQQTQLGNDDKKKKRKVWPWILLLLLIALGVGAFMFQDKLKDMLGMSSDVEHVDEVIVEDVIPVEVIEEIVEIDTTTADTMNVEEVIPEEIVEEVVEEPVVDIQSSSSGSYHIVGGAFGEEANADAFATKTGGTVIGRFNGMYQVAVKSYDTREEVNSAFGSVSSDYSGAWIFKYPK